MRISTDNDISRRNKAAFRQQCVLDAHLSDFEVICDLVFSGEFPYTFAVFRRLDILCRHKMIRNQRDFVLIKYAFFREAVHLADCDRRGYIISKNEVQFRFNQISGTDTGKPRAGSKNLLRHCHSHLRNLRC